MLEAWLLVISQNHHHTLQESPLLLSVFTAEVHDLHDGDRRHDDSRLSFSSPPQQSELLCYVGCHHCFYPLLLILINGWLLAHWPHSAQSSSPAPGHSGGWHSGCRDQRSLWGLEETAIHETICMIFNINLFWEEVIRGQLWTGCDHTCGQG